MSMHRMEPVTCPACKYEGQFILWQSVNTQLDPEMKSGIRDGSAFRWKCEKCGHETKIEYGFLYHQMEDGMMIAVCVDDENEKEYYSMFTNETEDAMFTEIIKSGYLLRIVRNTDELREKLFIFDAALDDRIIEMCKLVLLAKIQDDHPEYERVRLLFEKPSNKNEHVYAVIADGKYIGSISLPYSAYEGFLETYEGIIPKIREDDPIIDRGWSLRLLESRSNARKEDKEP